MRAFLSKWLGRRNAQASVVLRRQVPIRFDEPARSWLGGLPRMPDDIPWPRTDNGAPLHFIAQIACGDLPERIWNGRGPRNGWLLLFVDVLQMEDDSEGGLVQVLHVDRLGSERQPPEDMPTVRHAMGDYIGRFEPEMREGVPKLWRRWPVDLVVQQVPSPPSGDSGTGWEPLEVTGADLYGAPEDDENIDRFAEAELRPLTWRGALYLIEALMRNLSKDRREGGSRGIGLAELPAWEPGWLARAIADLKASHAQDVASLTEVTEKLRQPELSPEERAELEHDLRVKNARVGEAHLSWVEIQRSELERLRRHILTQDLDALIGDENWAAMKAKMIAAEAVFWKSSAGGNELYKVREAMFDLSNHGLKLALREDLLDLYSRSVAAQASIPPALRAELEPKLRHISRSSTPHRMGGPRDVMQGWADPDDDDLLFQIGSDGAMGWMWGDLGALFVYLRPSDLRARRFKRVEASIGGH